MFYDDGDSDFFMFDSDFKEDKKEDSKDDSLTMEQHWCNHEWKSIQLIMSTVYNCKKCDAKKEVVDKLEDKYNNNSNRYY